ncbi:hypothetical protein OEZ85_013500 [Tetradesmus obliquus]|uniref:BZIP domain-containing protein n=1 Tax=Tetradesmus obliquus TaxID=3088 RepID=A0ABY8URV1_TETOB|nr:hypothetical protein OEZ85_013500 [Tetradesmus obliquus]
MSDRRGAKASSDEAMKAEMRRFKNREAARRVRERKSTMLNTYKSQVDDLKRENQKLLQIIQQLQTGRPALAPDEVPLARGCGCCGDEECEECEGIRVTMLSSSSFPLVTTPGPKPKPLTLQDLGLPGVASAQGEAGHKASSSTGFAAAGGRLLAKGEPKEALSGHHLQQQQQQQMLGTQQQRQQRLMLQA